jgi:hypothetical protein
MGGMYMLYYILGVITGSGIATIIAVIRNTKLKNEILAYVERLEEYTENMQYKRELDSNAKLEKLLSILEKQNKQSN